MGKLESSVSYGDLQDSYHEMLRKDAEHLSQTGRLPGIRFGFSAIDDYTLGMRPDEGDSMILAGAPGSGKTSTAMAALRMYGLSELQYSEPKYSEFWSLEMGKRFVASRYMQMMSRATQDYLRMGMKVGEVDELFKKYADKERDLPALINFSHSPKLEEIREGVARSQEKNNVHVAVFDHLNMLRLANESRDKMQAQEDRIRFVVDRIAKELGVAVIVIAHSRKAAADREDKTPQMNDLSGSQQLSGAVDFLGFIYRPITTATSDQVKQGIFSNEEAYLVWRKNRYGDQGSPRFVFDGKHMSITDYGKSPMKQVAVERQKEIWG